MKKSKWIKVILFFVLLSGTLGCIFHWYSIDRDQVNHTYEAFYDEPKNTIDGAVFGTSVVGLGWNALAGWKDYGITVSTLGSSVQPFGALPELIEFAKSRQDLKYVVIDIHSLRPDAMLSSVSKNHIKRLSSAIHTSKYRYEVLQSCIDYAQRVYDYLGEPEDSNQLISKDDLDLYFPFLSAHNRWKEDGLTENDFVNISNPYKGAYDAKTVFKMKDNSKYVSNWQAEMGEVEDYQKEELQRLFDYLEDEDLDVLFVNYPSFNDADAEGNLKAIAEYIREQGYNMLDMATEEMAEEIGFDPATDLRDRRHANSKGAYKISSYICKYIHENYYAKDHRGEAGYESWDQAWEAYKEFFEKGWAAKGESITLE